MSQPKAQPGENQPNLPPERLLFAPDARAAHAELEARVAIDSSTNGAPRKRLTVVVTNPAARAQALGTLLQSGRALVGVEVQTLSGIAFGVLERAGQRPNLSRARFEIETLRRIRLAAGLRAATDRLEDGPALVLPTIDRLLEAGLDFELLQQIRTSPEILDELDGLPTDPRERDRFEELLAVAGSCAASAGGNVGLFRDALEVLQSRPDLGPNRVLLFGLRTAVGVEGQWISALFDRPGSSAIALGAPPTPEESSLHPLGRLTTEPGSPLPACPPTHRSGQPETDTSAEVRATVRRVVDQLEGTGESATRIAPERIAIALFGPERYSAELRVELKRYGVPFGSIELPGPTGPIGRELSALAKLLEQGIEIPLRQILPALGGESTTSLDRLALGLEVLGASRLSEIASLDLDHGLGRQTKLRLPLTYGRMSTTNQADSSSDSPSDSSSDAADDAESAATEVPSTRGDQATEPSYQALDRVDLERFIARCERLTSALKEIEAQPTVEQLMQATLGVLTQVFGTEPSPAAQLARRAVRELAGELGDQYELEFPSDWNRALGYRLRRIERPAFGAGAAGVRVGTPESLSTGRFTCLHILGLDRAYAPKAAPHDPWLSSSILDRLADLLGDPPNDLQQPSGQRVTFELLLGAAERVYLSRPLMDEDGKPKPASAWWPAGLEACESPTAPDAPRRLLASQMTSGRSEALIRGLVACVGNSSGLSTQAARARLEVLEELDSPPTESTQPGAGPYLGAIGPRQAQGESSGGLFVTTLEGLARCGWQTFLQRVLKITPAPDREAALPSLESRLTGTVAHDALEELAKRALMESGGRLPAPSTLECTRATNRAAERVVREAGLTLPGYIEIYSQRALPLVERAFVLLAQDVARIDAAETQGVATLQLGSASPIELHFRADLIERSVDGRRRFTDYKTGRPPGYETKTAKTVQKHLQEKLAAGVALQAAVYAASEAEAEGRYLHIGQDQPAFGDAGRSVSLDLNGDEEVRAIFEDVLGLLVGNYRAGIFPPRLVDPKGKEEGPWCRYCEVADACLRGDSGIRGRFERWLEPSGETPESGAPSGPFLDWLRLGSGKS